MESADRKFRIGASHAAGWIAETVKSMEAANTSASEMSRTVEDLMNVLVDWREEQVEMPKGNPWSWSFEELQDFIERRRDKW
jgi:hypothetical protein